MSSGKKIALMETLVRFLTVGLNPLSFLPLQACEPSLGSKRIPLPLARRFPQHRGFILL
jgi:hypothetical protein